MGGRLAQIGERQRFLLHWPEQVDHQPGLIAEAAGLPVLGQGQGQAQRLLAGIQPGEADIGRQGAADGTGLDIHRPVEDQLQRSIRQVAGELRLGRGLEDQALQRREARHAHRQHRRRRDRLACGFPGAGLGEAQALGELGDGFRRRAGHDAGPSLRQQIDEGLVAGLDQIGLVGLRQREAHAAPVGVDAGNGDVIGQFAGDACGIDLDLAAEGDDQHAAGDADAGLDRLIEGEGQAAEAGRHGLAAQFRASRKGTRIQAGGERESGQPDTEGEGARQTQTVILDPTRHWASPRPEMWRPSGTLARQP